MENFSRFKNVFYLMCRQIKSKSLLAALLLFQFCGFAQSSQFGLGVNMGYVFLNAAVSTTGNLSGVLKVSPLAGLRLDFNTAVSPKVHFTSGLVFNLSQVFLKVTPQGSGLLGGSAAVMSNANQFSIKIPLILNYTLWQNGRYGFEVLGGLSFGHAFSKYTGLRQRGFPKDELPWLIVSSYESPGFMVSTNIGLGYIFKMKGARANVLRLFYEYDLVGNYETNLSFFLREGPNVESYAYNALYNLSSLQLSFTIYPSFKTAKKQSAEKWLE